MVDLPAVVVAASTIAGRPVSVECGATPRPTGESGVYRSVDNTIILLPTVCTQLGRYQLGRVDLYIGSAVLTLAHEAEHASLQEGWLDETLTECRAIGAVPRLAALLGGPARVIRWARQAHWAARHFPGYGNYGCP